MQLRRAEAALHPPWNEGDLLQGDGVLSEHLAMGLEGKPEVLQLSHGPPLTKRIRFVAVPHEARSDNEDHQGRDAGKGEGWA